MVSCLATVSLLQLGLYSLCNSNEHSSYCQLELILQDPTRSCRADPVFRLNHEKTSDKIKIRELTEKVFPRQRHRHSILLLFGFHINCTSSRTRQADIAVIVSFVRRLTSFTFTCITHDIQPTAQH